MKILVLKGKSKYEVLRRAAEFVAIGMRTAGHDVEVDDMTRPDFSMKELLTGKYDVVFMNQAGLFDLKTADGRFLTQKLPSIFIGWIFDDVLYHYDRVCANRFPNTFLYSVDGKANEIAEGMGLKCNKIRPMLHGGFVAKHKWAEFSEHGTVINKPIDILCPCTMGKEPKWHRNDNEEGGTDISERNAVEQALDRWEKNPELSPRAALEGSTVSCETVLYVTDMIRYRIRRRILESVTGSGMNVVLVGEMGEKEQYPKNVTVRGPMDIDEVTELIAQSKVLINPFPTLYEEGAHERIFTSMLNGTVCFTPGYPFLRKLLGERLEYIDVNDMQDALDRMREITEHYADYLEPITDNAEYALANHTWERRGWEILQ